MKNIPRVIWQTHQVSYNDLDIMYKQNISIWLTKNTEWQHRYFNAVERRDFLINKGFLKNFNFYITTEPKQQKYTEQVNAFKRDPKFLMNLH